MNFRFLFIVPFVNHGLFEIFLLAEGHPKSTVVDSPARLNFSMPSFSKNSPFSVKDIFQMALARSCRSNLTAYHCDWPVDAIFNRFTNLYPWIAVYEMPACTWFRLPCTRVNRFSISLCRGRYYLLPEEPRSVKPINRPGTFCSDWVQNFRHRF